MFILLVERDEQDNKREIETKIYTRTQGREQQRVLIVGTSIRRTYSELEKKITQVFVFNIYLLIPFIFCINLKFSWFSFRGGKQR